MKDFKSYDFSPTQTLGLTSANRDFQQAIQNQQGSLNAPTPCDVSTSSKIRDGVNWLEASLAELHKILGALEQRLEMVLTPVCPSSAAAAPTPDKAFGSHLLSRLGDLNDAVCAAKARVVDLLNRVEV